jgi:hypothetical protein
MAKKDWDGDGKIESEKDEVWGSRFKAAKAAGKMEEEAEQVDEVSSGLAKRARHGALVKAYDLGNGTPSGEAASKIYRQQANVFDKYARNKEAQERDDATKASLPMSKQRKIAMGEETENLDEAYKIGDRVKINAPGFASHGHEGSVTKILPDGRHEVTFDKFVTGKQSRITTQSGLLGKPGETFKIPTKIMGGSKTTIEPSALRKIKEDTEVLDEVSSDLAKRARHAAKVKAYDYNNGTPSGEAASRIYNKQANVFDRYARNKEAQERDAKTRASLPMSKQRKIAMGEETIRELIDILDSGELTMEEIARIEQALFEVE